MIVNLEQRGGHGYTRDDVITAFSGSQYTAASSYVRQGRVSGVRFLPGGDGLRGAVRGNARSAYDVVVTILPPGVRQDRSSYGGRFRGRCSCPIGNNCKHVIAVLLQGLMLPPPSVMQQGAPSGAALIIPNAEAAAIAPEAAFSNWLAKVDTVSADVGHDPEAYPDGVRHRIFYQLSVKKLASFGNCLSVEVIAAQILKGGRISSSIIRINAYSSIGSASPQYYRPSDKFIVRTLGALTAPHYTPIYPLLGDAGLLLLQRILNTGRARWDSVQGPVVTLGPPLPGTLRWRPDPDGLQHMELVMEGGESAPGKRFQVLPLTPPWYLDLETHRCGPVDTDMAPTLVTALLAAPPVPPASTAWVEEQIGKRFPDRPALHPATFGAPVVRDVRPVPRLILRMPKPSDSAVFDLPFWGEDDREDEEYDFVSGMPPEAKLDFIYENAEVGFAAPRQSFQFMDKGQMVVIRRQPAFEKAALSRLAGLGFRADASRGCLVMDADQSNDDFEEDIWGVEGALGIALSFLHRQAPLLRAEGWQVETEGGLPDVLSEPGDDWSAEIGEEGSGIDWFGVSLGITVADERIDMVPLLLPLLQALPSDGNLDDLEAMGHANATLYLAVDEGRVLPLPASRVLPLVRALYDLFRVGGIDDTGAIRLTPARLAELAELEAAATATRLRWVGNSRLLELGRKLREGAGAVPVPPPAGLVATLRPYQQRGLEWLQFLRETGFSGVLADDMGLGKTIQALAHILTEKEAGRLDRSCLVVAPTSLMVNWRLEAARFAPDLTVLTLQGLNRKADFERIGEHDLVLTTYPLLHRDREVLLAREWHLLILDEAQAIKNPKAQASLVAVQLRARHRLCMTGTPMENNLDELWSLFHFLNPGLLGDSSQFRRVFRTPIEKAGDRDRQRLLGRRVRPFLLRRTKQEVATELPEKTEMVEHVTLEGAQRDLYESIRVTMDARVRAEVAAKGLARSHITILDALLKLRQVCCDPRLVKTATAMARGAPSAKLARLTEMLPELIADGRRILLFSQFTTMLGLIETELDRLKIAYVKLTGQTRDRATPVERFQAGEVPVFLISLKAGGTGLNLTAADTVILYDPWWNPAVERQAMDRAHRIGQDKAVFVYRLATVGTVEDAMLTLQARKQALADSLFDPETDLGGSLSADDIALLFQPLERL